MHMKSLPVANLLCAATALPHSKRSGAISFCSLFVGLQYRCSLLKQSRNQLLDDNLLPSHSCRSCHSGRGHNKKLTFPSKLLLLPGATIALLLWGHCFAQEGTGHGGRMSPCTLLRGNTCACSGLC